MIDVLDKLQTMASEIGIDLIGVANLEKLDSFASVLKKYEEEDIAFFHGKLYDKINYCKVWEKTKSIISFGITYNQNIPMPEDITNRGIISKCAYGEDYHRVLSCKAQELMQRFNEEICECQYRIFVDTGILSDRIIAYCAGLGFYGKNNFIINKKLGSFIFLGHILLDVDLKQNEIFKQSACSNCNLCISSCPSNAIKCDQIFDYKKCISYRTQKGTGQFTCGYIYGCDICQNVCPYNEKAPLSAHQEFYVKTNDAYPYLSEIINMGGEEYSKKYGHSSMYWRGYETIKRNCENLIKNHQD